MSAEFVPSVALAIDDFVPVGLAGAACLLLARALTRRVEGVRVPAYVGAVLVFLGGLVKAVWKLVVATGGPDLAWLESGLFVLLAPGFTLLVVALVGAYRGRVLDWWLPAAGVLAVVALSAVLESTAPLLVLTILAATAVGALAIALALRSHDRVAVALFGLQMTAAFALVPFAAPPQTEAKQWAEQSINTVGQLAFLLGALRLARAAAPRPESSNAASHAQEALA